MLCIHSGRQFGGFPIKVSKHAQTAWPFASLHILFGPHGDGSQGLVMGSEKEDGLYRICSYISTS